MTVIELKNILDQFNGDTEILVEGDKGSLLGVASAEVIEDAKGEEHCVVIWLKD